MGPFGMASQVKEHLQPSQASATAALGLSQRAMVGPKMGNKWWWFMCFFTMKKWRCQSDVHGILTGFNDICPLVN